MADVDMGLAFEGGSTEIKGESKIQNLEDMLVLQSYSWGVSSSRSAAETGGFGQGRATMSEMVCTMFADKAAAMLFKACSTNDHFTKVTLTLNRSGGEKIPYMKYVMEDAAITSYQDSGGGGNVVMISFSIAFKKMTETFTIQNDDGSKGADIEHEYSQAIGA